MVLNSALNGQSAGPRVGVTLIESPKVPTVGVGGLPGSAGHGAGEV